MSSTITCPNCGSAIEISEAMSAQVANEIRREFEKENRVLRQRMAEESQALEKSRRELETRQQALDDHIRERLEKEKAALLDKARREALESLAVEAKDREQQLNDTRLKLKEANERELAWRKRERDLQEQAEQIELTVTRQVEAERQKIRESVRKQADEENQFKAKEKEQQIEGLRKQIDDLKRRAEQGSQQTQGEVLELALEELLRRTFPHDLIEEVGKGVSGGDIIHRVRSGSGADCGLILWETKRTKTWSDQWLPKLRQDQREAKAAVAILVSAALPAGLDHFQQIDGIWVCSWSCAPSVAAVLREFLLETAKIRCAIDGRHDKMERVYHYLSGTEFRNRITGIMESFTTLQSDLDAEKRVFEKQWAKRQMQIDRALRNTSGMYGDLQGIIGATLPEIESMELPRLTE